MAASKRLRDAGDWYRQAACLGQDTSLWFPERGDGGGKGVLAKMICELCPVREPCLEVAMAAREAWGIWGGLSESERAELRKVRS